MALFYYEGKNLSGEKISGVIESKNESLIVKKIKNQGYIPVKIKKININSFTYTVTAFFNKISFCDLAVFCRQLAVMLDAGVTILESLTSIAKQTENKRLREIIFNLNLHIRRGDSLAEACRNQPYVFSEIFICMIEAGELSGNLSDILKILSAYYSDMSKQNEKIKSAMIYPSILGVTSLFVVIFLTTKVLPVYVNIFSSVGVQLPKITQIFMFLGSNIVNLCIIVFVLFVLLFLGIIKYQESAKIMYQIDKLKLSIPFMGQLIKKSISSQIARLLYILTSSGIPILKALEVSCNTVKNQVIKMELKKVHKGLKQGKNLSELMSEKIFSPMMVKIIAIGEESGALEEMLDKAASFSLNEAKILEDRLILFVEPVIIIVLTLIISFIVISVVIPMFDIYNLF
ncbi:type II secretion system F family protein [Tepidanaerobacter sp. EBM-38]|uniref:type II secretion system F family protein n=1 Tax=Tepidanaerobacter sp. EBM-38 TaxID=1918496 RepID=UPI000AFF58E5|nr:type II secretion system F family protein [Tepidanaerobacter sp. EBM-38]